MFFLKDQSGSAVLNGQGLPIVLPELEISMDKLIDEGWDFQSEESSLEEVVINRLEIKALHRCLNLLTADERQLIDALFFEEIPIHEYAKRTGQSKSKADRFKTKTLGKLKVLMTG